MGPRRERVQWREGWRCEGEMPPAELEGALPGSCSPRWRLYMTFITTVSSHNGANSCGMDWPNVKPCTPPSSQQM